MLILVAAGFVVVHIVAAYWLGRHQYRVFLYIAGAISCFAIPYGTVLGIFTFLVLSRPAAMSLFQAKIAPPNAPPPATDQP